MSGEGDKVVPCMTDYHISEHTGFMISDPLEYLPEYFEIWNRLGKDVDTFTAERKLRKEVDNMPLLDHEKLSSYREKRLAFQYLAFIGNCYIWQDGDTGMAKRVPKQLAIPWAGLARELGLPLCLCHACCMLSNWMKVDPNGDITLDNMRGICWLPGKPGQSEWFFLVTAAVELAGLPALKAIEEAMKDVNRNDSDSMKNKMDDIVVAITASKEAFKRMGEKLEPSVFYNEMRPFLSGWGGDSTPQAEEGVIFEGVSDNKPLKVIGGSAAQSSYVQCVDAGLGITHAPDKQKFLDLMKEYMVPAHADYIRALSRGPSIREYVMTQGDAELTEKYNKCVDAVTDFRSYHIQSVTRYIVLPSNANRSNDFDSVSQRGTGGQDLIPFLKNIRETTNSHSLARNN